MRPPIGLGTKGFKNRMKAFQLKVGHFGYVRAAVREGKTLQFQRLMEEQERIEAERIREHVKTCEKCKARKEGLN